jgi:ribonuclease P/MRP protein subunit RPP40
LLRTKIINKQQHGFLAKHSTDTNLLRCIHDWALAIDSKQCVDIVYVDFSQAFDSVVHSKLIHKLDKIGIGGCLLTWIGAFLSDRTQSTVIEHCASSITSVLSGVIQGSVIGPILFIIFINDVVNIFNSNVNCLLYADDLKLYTVLPVDLNISDLLNSVGKLEAWASDWQLRINISKCNSMHLGARNPEHCYSINGILIANKPCTRDLGVEIDQKLKFNNHINLIVSKAYQRVALIYRGFSTRNPAVLKQAYLTYVRPILEYGCHVWSPMYIKYIDAVEKVQKRFTKKISGLRDLHYLERLAILNLDTLELRRLRSDLYLYYKIYNGISSISASEYFVPDPCNRITRSSAACNFVKPQFKCDVYMNSFFVRQIDAWNSLPVETRTVDSFIAFKKLINSTDFSIFLKGSCYSF